MLNYYLQAGANKTFRKHNKTKIIAMPAHTIHLTRINEKSIVSKVLLTDEMIIFEGFELFNNRSHIIHGQIQH